MLEINGPQDFREFILQRESPKKLLVYFDEKSASLKHHTYTGVITV
jgi:hypothetical protein